MYCDYDCLIFFYSVKGSLSHTRENTHLLNKQCYKYCNKGLYTSEIIKKEDTERYEIFHAKNLRGCFDAPSSKSQFNPNTPLRY